MADMATEMNNALLDAAVWAGVSVWVIIGAIAACVLILLIIVVYLIIRWSKPSAKAPAQPEPVSAEDIELVEKTLAEFPADQVKIEATNGKVVIKVVNPKSAAEEPSLPQEKKEAPLPSKVEKKKPEEPEPESEPIAMGAAESESK